MCNLVYETNMKSWDRALTARQRGQLGGSRRLSGIDKRKRY
jgi:hypothetical protein